MRRKKTRATGKGQKDRIHLIDTGFKSNLEGLRVFIRNVTPVARQFDQKSVEEVASRIAKVLLTTGIPVSELKKTKSLRSKLTREQAIEINDALMQLRRFTPFQVQLLYGSSFVMLICYFDFLISDLIHHYYEKYPESLSGKELSIKLSELQVCGDLTEAVDHIINKEVDRVLYDNLENQRKYIENHLGVDTKTDLVYWNRINEAMERRHLIVHNNARINRRYLSNVDLSIVPEKAKDLKEGKEIAIHEDYFATIFDEICVAGIILTQRCWRKWLKADTENADLHLLKDIYDTLVREEWRLAERLGLFSRECKLGSEQTRLFCDINYCQSLKWQNKEDELQIELNKFDTSTLSPIYLLAVCALRSDEDGFYRNIKNAITVDGMQEWYFKEWPLFRELRQDPEYERRVTEIFTSISPKDQQ